MTETRTLEAHDRGRPLAWLFLIALVIAIGTLPGLVSVAPPDGALTISKAYFSLDGGRTEKEVSLPHGWVPETPYELATATYRLVFQAPDVAGEPLFLLIPAARHSIEAWVNGQRAASALDTAWSIPTSGYAFLARIPDDAVHAGDNEIVLRQTREIGWLPARLSQASVGTAGTVFPTYKLSNLLIEQVRAMTFALHIVLTISIAVIWGARRHDPVFRWLALIAISSLLVALTQSPLAPLSVLEQFRSTAAISAVGLMVLGLATAIAGWHRTPLLLPAIIIVPAILLVAGQTGLLPFPVIGLLSACVGLGAYAAAAVVLAQQFAQRRNWAAAVLAVPCAVTVWFGLHDVLVVTGRYDDPFLLSSYGRTLMLLAIMLILMGRLVRSLNSLDNANDTLQQRLKAQETELGLLHEQQRSHANQLVREHERQRLMQDLHDGVSGHLVTIIALAERDKGAGEPIERAARAALEDLRLVVHSLDLSDGDLRVALAAFRERLEPQLRRLGIEFQWSTENLPEVSGVTPRNALSVLRILQEAVTNAIKHGPARRIAIEGRATADQRAALQVFNDGTPPLQAGKGNGLANMQRRARDLGGHITFAPTNDGASLSLVLPTQLPE